MASNISIPLGAAACFAANVWAGATATLFVATKVGSLQPTPVFCPCPKSTAAGNATSMLPTMSVHRRGERNGEPQSEPYLSCTVHLSAPEKDFESHSDLRPSTTTEALETKYVKDKLRPAPERARVPSFLIFVCGPVLGSPLLHPSKQLPNALPEFAYETTSPGPREIST